MHPPFYKGRTNNHVTWAMVDATDFATRESALSAATKMWIYGKTRGATTASLVKSGTGSMTNDFIHVGPSIFGLYTCALVKADLSGASAWYDQYVINLSGTGAAFQTLVIEGLIDESALLSHISDILSGVNLANSRILVGQSAHSDMASFLAIMSAIQSDLFSAVLLTQSMASDAASAAQQGNSRILLLQSAHSDTQSFLSDFRSDLHSFVSTTGVGLNASTMSDLRSAINALTVTITASDVSDIASAVVAGLPVVSDISDILSLLQRVDSRVLVGQSYLSHLSAVLSDFESNFSSRVPKLVATNSQVSDLMSDTRSLLILNASGISDLYSALSNLISGLADASDIASAVWAHADGAANTSRILLNLSRISDLQSQVSDFRSDLHSFVSTTGVGLNASTMSDLRSAIAAVTVVLDASNISDIASAVVAAIPFGSQISDILSQTTILVSQVLVNQSAVSNIASVLSNLDSNFESRVPKEVAARSQLSGLVSDLNSYISDVESNLRSLAVANHSAASDILSQTTIIGSRVLVAQSALSDFRSQVTAGVALTAAGVDAIWDEAKSGHTTQGTFGESYNGIVSFTVGAGSTTTNIETGLTEATDDHYNGRTLVFITGALAGQATSISDYSGAGKSLTVVALTESPANGDRAVIV